MNPLALLRRGARAASDVLATSADHLGTITLHYGPFTVVLNGKPSSASPAPKSCTGCAPGSPSKCLVHGWAAPRGEP